MDLEFRPENEHVVRWDGHRTLMAAGRMAIFEIDDVADLLLRYGRERRRCTIEDLVASAGPDVARSEALRRIGELVELGIFIPAGTRAPARRPPPIDVEAFPMTSLVLNVTNRCNMHCSYCYEPDDAKYGEGARNMTWETSRRSVDFLFERSGRAPRVNLIFFGGEALLNFPLMERIVEYAAERGKAAGKDVDFSVTTNGSLLNDRVVDFFARHRFGVTISMDGPRDIQDRRRRIGKTNGSYDVVVSRVRRLMERYTARPVVARVTLTKGTLQIPRIYEHLRSLGFFEVGFAPVTARDGEEWGLDAADLEELLSQFRELGNLYLERALRDEYTGFSNLSTLLADLHAGTNKALPCGAGLGLLDVDAAGDLYLCHRFPGSDEHRYGNVGDPASVEYDRIRDFLGRATLDNKPVCQTCWIRGLCGGGCYHEAHTEFGDGLLPNLHYCGWLRAWIEYGIRVYVELQEKNPGFIDRFVVAGRADTPGELT